MPSNPPRHSPLSKNHDLNEASAQQLRAQLCFELKEVKKESGLGNEDLALKLGYKSGASVSRWLRGHDPVSEGCAKKLDALGYKPHVGSTFAELQRAYRRAQVTRGRQARKSPSTYDVFLASPMASLTEKQFSEERAAARGLMRTIENSLELTVYYAGETLESQDELDSPLVAAEQNFDALHNARYFVLLSVTEALKPSSVTVEAGYALARRIPSLYLVRHVEHLPFVLRSLGSNELPELPAVAIEVVKTRDRAMGLMRRQGEAILNRLEEQTRPAA